MKPWHAARQYRSHDEHGFLTPSYTRPAGRAGAFRETLATPHADFASLIDQERCDAADFAFRNIEVDRELALTPSYTQATRIYACMKGSKGVGESRIGGDAHRLAPHAHTQIMFALRCSSCLYISRPLLFNGGQLLGLWRNKGSTSKTKTQY